MEKLRAFDCTDETYRKYVNCLEIILAHGRKYTSKLMELFEDRCWQNSFAAKCSENLADLLKTLSDKKSAVLRCLKGEQAAKNDLVSADKHP